MEPLILGCCRRSLVSLVLEGLYGPVETGVATKPSSEGRYQQGGSREVLQQISTFANQQIHLVPSGGYALVEGDSSQAGCFRQVPGRVREKERN